MSSPRFALVICSTMNRVERLGVDLDRFRRPTVGTARTRATHRSRTPTRGSCRGRGRILAGVCLTAARYPNKSRDAGADSTALTMRCIGRMVEGRLGLERLRGSRTFLSGATHA
jgi:hypothetical protein